jgi:hypothetical protein
MFTEGNSWALGVSGVVMRRANAVAMLIAVDLDLTMMAPSAVLFLEELCDGLQLHVAGAFVDGADFGISIEFLCWELFSEANATEEFNAFGSSPLCDL